MITNTYYGANTIVTSNFTMTKTLTTIFILSLFSSNYFGQIISGTVTDQKGDTLPFATIILDTKKNISSTSSDLDGQFSFKEITDFKQKSIYAIFGKCYSDTIQITQSNYNQLKIAINISDECCPKVAEPNCRYNYIMKGDVFYVDVSNISKDKLKIITGEQILAKKDFSPYDYQIILPDKKYKADNGQVFTGAQLIKQKHLSRKLWDNADFIPIDNK